MDADEGNFEARLSALQADVRSYASELHKQFQGLHSSLLSGDCKVDLRNDPRNCIKSLRVDLTDALDDAAARAEKQVSETAGQDLAQLEKCDRLAAILQDATDASDAICKAEESLASSDLALTCDLLDQMDEVVQRLPRATTEVGDGEVCRLLRREARLPGGRFCARLLRLLHCAIRIDPGRIHVLKAVEGMVPGEDMLVDRPIPLADVWTALVRRGEAEEAARQLVASAVHNVVRPLWRERTSRMPLHTTRLDRAELVFEGMMRDAVGSGSGGSRGNTVTPDSAVTAAAPMPPNAPSSTEATARGMTGLGACRMPLPAFLEHLAIVLTFLWTQVLCEDDCLAPCAAACLDSGAGAGPVSGSGAGLNSALGHTLKELVPKNEADLVAFQRGLERQCTDFDVKLGSLGLFGEQLVATDAGLRLPDLARRLPALFTEVRRRSLLAEARALVLADYHNTMLTSGDAQTDDMASAGGVGDRRLHMDQSVKAFSADSLGFEVCQVSLTSCRLLKLVHSVLREACAANAPQLAQALYQTARDCLELFIALVPMRYADVIHTNTRMGAVFYNDCTYMAHNTTLLTHSMAQAMEKQGVIGDAAALRDCVGFMDFIPRLRVLGEKCLATYVDRQQSMLRGLLEEVRLNTTDEDDEEDEQGGMPLRRGDGGDREGEGAGPGPAGSLVGSLVERLGLAPREREGGDRDTLRHRGGEGGGTNDEVKAAQLTQHLEGLREQWQAVLQESVYERLIGHLVGAVLATAMDRVTSATLISENACNDMIRVFRTLQGCQTLFVDPSPQGVARVVPCWTKFSALTDLLGYSVNEIAEWMPRLKFADFTAQELTHLVQALFDESPRRKRLETAILEMGSSSSKK